MASLGDLYRRGWGDARGVDRLERILVLAAAVALVVAVLAFLTDQVTRDEAPDADAAAQGTTKCRDAKIPANLKERFNCQTTSGVQLTIAPEDVPVILGGVSARVTDARATEELLRVTARLRNSSETPVVINPSAGNVYVSLRGKRLRPRQDQPRALAPQEGTTVQLRFTLAPGDAQRLRSSRGRFELAVRPANSDVNRLAVIRLRVRPPRARPEAPTVGGSGAAPAQTPGAAQGSG